MAMGLRELCAMLRAQIRDHDAMLGAMRALARAVLVVSAAVLGTPFIRLGSLASPVNGGRLGGLAAGGRRSHGRNRGGSPWAVCAFARAWGAPPATARLPLKCL